MFCPNFSITDQHFTYLWGKISAQGYMSLGDTSKGNMILAPRCNSKTRSMFVSATNLVFCPNFSITDQLFTNLWGKIGAQGYMSSGVTSRGNMTLAPRRNAKTHSTFVRATHLIFCPNFSITDQLFTYLWGKIGAQGYMSLGVMSSRNMTLAPRCNCKTYCMFVSATHLMFCPNFSITDQLFTYLWVKQVHRGT